MPDYKEMYLKLFRSCTQAIDLLQAAQRESEERYMSQEETELKLLCAPETETLNEAGEAASD